MVSHDLIDPNLLHAYKSIYVAQSSQSLVTCTQRQVQPIQVIIQVENSVVPTIPVTSIECNSQGMLQVFVNRGRERDKRFLREQGKELGWRKVSLVMPQI